MHKFLWAIIALIVVALGVLLFLPRESRAPEVTPTAKRATTNDVPMPPASAIRELTLESGKIFFNPKKLVVKKGEPVRLTITNAGRHTFTIDELGINEKLDGPTKVLEFTPTKSGSFQYYCAIPGHRQAGQEGTLVVEE